MSTLVKSQFKEARAQDIEVNDEELKVTLEDGRLIAVPIEWFPRLRDASKKDKNNWRFIGGGIGIHWEAIDEDISIESLLKG